MDITQLNAELVTLVEKKQELSGLDYNDPQYDDIEEALHDLEDDFVDTYGDYLEEAFHMVHDEFCPDDDVLLPIAYLPNKFVISKENGQTKYDVGQGEGVVVGADDYPGKLCRLALLPNPTRIVLKIGNSDQETVWHAK